MTDDSPDRPHPDADDVARVAQRLGLDVDDPGERSEAAAAVVAIADRLPRAGTDIRATAVEEGDDEYGAVRHRFDLPPSEGPLSARVGVKANLAVAGVPSDCGAAVDPVTPAYTATAVERLRLAGANVVATTAMDELAYSATGTTGRQRVRNPRATDRVPGGSSSGSAAAVAGGLVDLALGSDTAGSVRIPAAHCGVVGLKPTRGAVPRSGLVDLAPTLDHVGLLGDDVGTVGRALPAVRGPDAGDPMTVDGTDESAATAPESGPNPGSLTVGVVEETLESADPDVRSTVEATVENISALGVTVERVSVPDWELAAPATAVLIGAELAALVASDGVVPGAAGGTMGSRLLRRLRETGAHGDTLRSGLLAHGTASTVTDGATYARAAAARRAVTDGIADVLGEVDALVTPTTPGVAPRPTEADPASLDAIANTGPFNLSGHPAVSVPTGRVEGAPVGVQVATGRGQDQQALQVGELVEDVTEN